MTPIRLLVVDDHAGFRHGLRNLLDSEPDLAVVGEAANGVTAVAAVAVCHPDVVLMDIEMPELNGIAATRQIVAQDGAVGVLMLTVYQDPQVVFQAIKAGARGYVLKNAHPVELVQAIRTVATGGALIDPALAAVVLQEFQRCWAAEIPMHATPPRPYVELTERERAILSRIAAGWSNKQIGQELGLADKTIRNSLTIIFHKLQVGDRAQAAVYAVQQGLAQPHHER